MWKSKNQDGYVEIKSYEHIVIMERYLERALPPGTQVHHRNRNRADNRIENLLLMKTEYHRAIHVAMERGDEVIIQALEECSFHMMEKLKAGLADSECLRPCLSLIENANGDGVHQSIPCEKRLMELRKKLLIELIKGRERLAKQRDMPADLVFRDRTLEHMAEKMPTSDFLMLQIYGVGPFKLLKYGRYFLKIITVFKAQNPTVD